MGDFGAIGGSQDDVGSLQAALDSFPILGGVLHLPRETYRTEQGLDIRSPVSLSGDGGGYTAINPASSAASQDTLTITPSSGTSFELQRIEGLALHDPRTGARRGRHGIMLSTLRRNELLPKLTIRDVIIGQGSGYAINHEHDPSSGAEGGLFAATIENCLLKGGIRLNGSGDSNAVLHCVISGTNIGVSAGLITGASLLNISGNNITNDGGALKITSGSRFRFLGNNVENTRAGAASLNNGSVVNLAGMRSVIVGGVVAENLISAFGATDASVLLRLRNCRGTSVRDNVFAAGTPGFTAIEVGEDCEDIRIGQNTYNGGISVPVHDLGKGTMGVVKTVVLQHDWMAGTLGAPALQFMKGCDGLVSLWGEILNGRSDDGTTVGVLPVGFRPARNLNVGLPGTSPAGALMGRLHISEGGTLSIQGVPGARVLYFSFSFPDQRLGHAISPE